MPALDIRNLTVHYAIKGGTLQALAPVNLALRDGDFVVALGASEGSVSDCEVLHYEAPFGVGYLVAQLARKSDGLQGRTA